MDNLVCVCIILLVCKYSARPGSMTPKESPGKTFFKGDLFLPWTVLALRTNAVWSSHCFCPTSLVTDADDVS